MNKQKKTYIIRISVILSFILILCITYKDNTDKNFLNSLRMEHLRQDSIKRAKFTYVYNKFSQYNKDIDTLTVKKFIQVVEYFKLDSTKQILDVCISQICLESGAKQYKANGKLLENSSNAVGIAQITHTTAFHYLRNVAGKTNMGIFTELGGKKYDFVFKYEQYKPLTDKSRKKIRDWTKDVTNNLILWGFIMHKTLNSQNNDINLTLIVYNRGVGGLNSYVNQGNDTSKHEYVVLITNIMKKLNG